MAMLGNSDIYEICLAKYGFFCLSLWYCSKSRIVTFFFFSLRLQMQSMWHYKLKFAVVLSLWLQNTHKLQVLIDGKPPKEAFTNSPRKELSQKNPYKFYLYYVWILKTGKGCKWFKRDLQASDSCWIFPLGFKSWQSWCTLYFFFLSQY